jgi:hypothetical protein
MTLMKAAHTEFQFVSWSSPEVAWTIEYPQEVMDEIRLFACGQLPQLASSGAEVGGVMFGSQRAGTVRILTWRPIACDHSEGEKLSLSHRDRMNLAVELEAARRNRELKDLRPVGWFVSHHIDGVLMTPSDVETYSGFFPESSQVTLVIHPTGEGRAEAGFFVRETDGSVRTEASYNNFILVPMVTPPTDAGETERSFESAGSPPSASPLIAPLIAPPIAPPAFETEEPLPARERWLWAIPIVLALGLGAWPLYISIGSHGQKPAESLPVAFHISSSSSRTVQLEWDPKSRTILDSERGEIDITDGGKSSQVTLSSAQLRAGKMTYLAKSGDVEFDLALYPPGGSAVHETARMIAPAFSEPAQPPQLLPPPSPDANSDALQKQVKQLTEELRKERERADRFQNLNRILENRLNIQPGVPKAEPQP